MEEDYPEQVLENWCKNIGGEMSRSGDDVTCSFGLGREVTLDGTDWSMSGEIDGTSFDMETIDIDRERDRLLLEGERTKLEIRG